MPLAYSTISCGTLLLYAEENIAPEEITRKICKSFYQPSATMQTTVPVGPACATCGHQNTSPLPWPYIGERKGLVLFSHQDNRAATPGYTNWAFKFAEYLRKNKLGEVVRTRTWVNPNTNHPICTWMWYIDHPALKAWNQKNKPQQSANLGNNLRV